jgi:hypothetical protein
MASLLLLKLALLPSPITACPGTNIRLEGLGVGCVWMNMLRACHRCAPAAAVAQFGEGGCRLACRRLVAGLRMACWRWESCVGATQGCGGEDGSDASPGHKLESLGSTHHRELPCMHCASLLQQARPRQCSQEVLDTVATHSWFWFQVADGHRAGERLTGKVDDDPGLSLIYAVYEENCLASLSSAGCGAFFSSLLEDGTECLREA